MRALGPCARKWAFKIHCGVRPKMEVEYYFDGALEAYINCIFVPDLVIYTQYVPSKS